MHINKEIVDDIEIPPNSATLQSGISNRHSRTKSDTINGNVYNISQRKIGLFKDNQFFNYSQGRWNFLSLRLDYQGRDAYSLRNFLRLSL